MLRLSSNSIGDVGRSLARGGSDLLDPFHPRHHVLDRVDDVRLHDLGRRALVGHGDAHDREVHVGVLADAQAREDVPEAREADHPEADEREHQHPGEHVVADGDVGQGHSGGDLLRILRFPLPIVPARLFAHGRPIGRSGCPLRQRRHRLHFDAVGQPVRALHDHRFPPLDPRQDLHHPGSRAQPDLDRPDAGLSLLDHVGHEPLLAGLDRALRHHERLLPRLAGQRHLREEAGLQLSRVLNPGHALDLTGLGIRDLPDVVDLRGKVPGAERRDPEVHGVALVGTQGLAFRDLEAQAQAAGVHERREHHSRLYELAGLHRLRVYDAGMGRPYFGLAHVLDGDVAVGLGRLRGGTQPRGLAPRAVQLLRGHELALVQLLAALQVGFRAALLGQALLVAGLRLLGLQPEALGIDAQEHGLGVTRSPSWNRTSVTAPSTSAVTWTISSASSEPRALIR